MISDNLFRDYPEVIFMISFFSVIFVLQKTVFLALTTSSTCFATVVQHPPTALAPDFI